MRRQDIGYAFLALALLAAPACGRSETRPGGDIPATGRASDVTNEGKANGTPRADQDRNRGAATTGTTGSVASDEEPGAGPDATITMKIQPAMRPGLRRGSRMRRNVVSQEAQLICADSSSSRWICSIEVVL